MGDMPSDQGPSPAVTSLRDAFRTLAIAALIGSGALHFAHAPPHFDEAASHGAFFVIVAWAQFGAAFALLRWRDRPEPWLAAGALSVGVMAVWFMSRSGNLPGEPAEPIGFADALATALEGLTVLAVLVARLPSIAAKPVPRLSPVLGAVAVVAVVGSVSLSLTPTMGGNHSHADGANGDGHDHGDVETVSIDREERCDIGFNTATFNETSRQAEPVIHDDDGGVGHDVDFTLEEFAEVFVQPDNPMSDGGATVETFIQYVRSTPEREGEVLSGGMTHSLEPDNWMPMTDDEECRELAEELERTRAVAERYPTAQDAMDAGYFQVTAYLPAIAAHFINPAYIGAFDIDNPGMLLYDGDGPDARIVGISHYLLSDEYPEAGFTGPNDHWHRHVGLCMAQVNGLPRVVGGTSLTDEQCQARGGRTSSGTDGYMSHTWVVPGCESDWGLFSGANPAIVTRGASGDDPLELDNTDPVPTGCGSGKSLDDPLDFDQEGRGPSLD
jgi:hypothetical protein